MASEVGVVRFIQLRDASGFELVAPGLGLRMRAASGSVLSACRVEINFLGCLGA